MKSCIFHKKYLLAGIYIIFVLFTCCNSRFYHTPLAKIMFRNRKTDSEQRRNQGLKRILLYSEYYGTDIKRSA